MACREQETVGSKCDVCTKALPLRLRDLGRGGDRETVRIRGGGWVSKETGSSRHSRSDVHKNSQRLWQDTQNLHILESNKNPSRHKVPRLRSYLQLAAAGKWKVWFSNDASLLHQPHFRTGSMPRQSWLTQNRHHVLFCSVWFDFVFLRVLFCSPCFFVLLIFFIVHLDFCFVCFSC